MRLIIEASEDAPEPVEPVAEPEPVVDTSKTDELEGKIIKYKKKLRMEKEKIQSLEDQLAISAQELDKLRSQALEATGHQNYPHTSSVNVYKNQTGKASQLNPMYSPGDKS